MRKIIISLSFLSILLTACGSEVNVKKPPPEGNAQPIQIENLPDRLRDCSFDRIETPGLYPYLYVTRCPNSTTSTTNTRTKASSVTTVVIDGVEYEVTKKEIKK